MESGKLLKAIEQVANRYDLDPAVVWAIVAVESGGCQHAARYEPGYRYLLDPARVRPLACSVETEKALQMTSWGLMQVMGAVLREKGFRGWLTEILSDADAQLDYGCMHLAKYLKMYGGELPLAIAAYNAGTARNGSDGRLINQDYVDRVLREAEKYRAVKDSSPEVKA
jgi:soluble lytic murein transglycosylase-like protein